MDPLERSQDIYETVPGYPPAPQPPTPAPGRFLHLGDDRPHRFTLFASGVGRGDGADRLQASSGEDLPQQIEHLQRTVNLRGPALYAQAVSATLALLDDPRPLTPFQRAATLVFAVAALHDDFFAGALPPDTVRGAAAEMGQYANLFATSVVWADGRPRLYKSKVTGRIAVLARGRFFIVDMGRPGMDLAVDDLAAILESCAALASESAEGAAELTVARLTAASDMTQYKVMPAIIAAARQRRVARSAPAHACHGLSRP